MDNDDISHFGEGPQKGTELYSFPGSCNSECNELNL
jgi:hypothetical protein